MKSKTLRITSTAVLIALLIAAQAATASLSQYVTGSLVNLILITAVMTTGLASGITVAVTSPLFAKLLNIGPLWTIIPFIIAGNAALVLVWHIIGGRKFANAHIARVIALAAAAVCKFAVLYVGIVKIAIPFMLNLPEKQAAVTSGMFSFPQLVTASTGGVLALAVLPAVQLARLRFKQ